MQTLANPQHPAPQHIPMRIRRMAGSAGVRIDLAPRSLGSRPTRIGAISGDRAEPILSVEDAIRRYVEAQPPQLYRGGL